MLFLLSNCWELRLNFFSAINKPLIKQILLQSDNLPDIEEVKDIANFRTLLCSPGGNWSRIAKLYLPWYKTHIFFNLQFNILYQLHDSKQISNPYWSQTIILKILSKIVVDGVGFVFHMYTAIITAILAA